MEAAVTLMITETNIALRNSNTSTKLRLVHMKNALGFREKAINATIAQLRNVSDPDLGFVHRLRNEKKADLVQILTDHRLNAESGIAGVASLPNSLWCGAYDPTRAFSVISVQYTSIDSIPAHEFG